MKNKWIFLFAIFGLVSLACSITLPFNFNRGSIGNTETLEISVPSASPNTQASLDIEMGGGVLNIAPGSQQLVSGTVQYNVTDWKPTITTTGNSVTIKQNIQTVPIQPNHKIVNTWNLQLGQNPMDLTLQAGAYDATLDLSGLSLTNLVIKDGASNSKVTFDMANPVVMQEFTYKTGASNVSLTGLANANFQQMTFTGGAGKATFDFGGSLQQDMSVKITAAAGEVVIIVPQGTRCSVDKVGELATVNYQSGWTQNGNTYSTEGQGYQITIEANVSIGNLSLETSQSATL
jgi:hypothetical protein